MLYATCGFDWKNGSDGFTFGEGRDPFGNRGALAVLEAAKPAYVVGFNAVSGDFAGYVTTEGFVYKDKTDGWSARGTGIMAIKVFDGSVSYLALVSGDSGGLELWRYFGNVGGTQALLGTFAGVLSTPGEYGAYVELQVGWDPTNSHATVRVGGTVVYDADTGVARGEDLVWHTYGPPETDGSPATAAFYVDDVYILDNNVTDGYGVTTFLGDRSVITVFPAGVGNYTDWTSTSPAGQPHWRAVGGLVGTTDSYVLLNPPTGGTFDSYRYQSIPGPDRGWADGDVVQGIKRVLTARTEVEPPGGGPVPLGAVAWKSGIGVSQDSDGWYPPVGSWAEFQESVVTYDLFYFDSASTRRAWTAGYLRSVEYGPRVLASAASGEANVSALAVELVGPRVSASPARSGSWGQVVG